MIPVLIGQRLQVAELNFVSVKARHRDGEVSIGEVVCETEADAEKIRAWADREGVPVEAVRVATAEELARYNEIPY